MGKSFWIASESESFAELIEGDFRWVFLFDHLGVLGNLGCAPMEWFKSQIGTDVNGAPEMTIPAEDLDAWLNDCRNRMNAHRDTLPTLYQIWQADDYGLIGSEGYLIHNGDIFQAAALWDSLTITPARGEPSTIQSRLAGLTYTPPDTRKLSTPLPLIPYKGPRNTSGIEQYVLDASTFNELFRDTPISLEYGNFADYFAKELGLIERVIEKCKASGERVYCSF